MDRIDKLLKQWKEERPDLDASSMAILGRLMILDRLALRAVEKLLSQHNITIQEFDVLAVIRRCGPPFRQPVGVLCEYSIPRRCRLCNVDRYQHGRSPDRYQRPADALQPQLYHAGNQRRIQRRQRVIIPGPAG